MNFFDDTYGTSRIYFSTIFALISKSLHMEATPPIRFGRVGRRLLMVTTTPSSSSCSMLGALVDRRWAGLLKISSPYFSMRPSLSKVFFSEVGVPRGVSDSDSEDMWRLTLGLVTFLSSALNK